MPAPKRRILADEDIPVELCSRLRAQGHDVLRAPPGTTNGNLLALAQRKRRVLVTADNDFAKTENLSVFDSFGVILLRFATQEVEAMEEALKNIFKAAKTKNITGKLIIADPNNLQFIKK